MNIHSWFPLRLTGLISLQSKGLSRVFSSTTVGKHQFFSAQLSLWSNSHIHTWQLEKTIALTIWNFVSKVISLLFNTLSRFVITFLPKNKCLLILTAAIICINFWAQENKVYHCFYLFPIYSPRSDGTRGYVLVFWLLDFKPAFHSTLSSSSTGSLVPLCFLH